MRFLTTARSGLGSRAIAVAATLAAAAAMFWAEQSQAAIPDVFAGDVACAEQPDGTRFCGSESPRSTVKTFDGVPIDVNVAFPPAPASGADGNYPLVMLFHGYGGSKLGLDLMQDWVDRGYAAFSMTDRGFHESCGSAASRAADPGGCDAGYVRLLDTRYEVRDAQELAGALVDEGLVDPARIGATGGSYGGALSLALAALRDRKMLPDGSLVEWRSPGGVEMELAAAAPFITWSDLAQSLTPNGSTLDYVADSPYSGRVGVLKESLVEGLYLSGLTAPGFYVPEGTDPSADLTGWRDRLQDGEPLDDDPEAQAILDEVTTNHSAYYIDSSVEPAPILLANSPTDDLFPMDEAVRYYNRTRAEHPDAEIGLMMIEGPGHPRSQNKEASRELQGRRIDRWLDHYVLGQGSKPKLRVEAYTQTCPTEAAAGGPYRARDWARLAPGEVRLAEKSPRTIEPGAGSDELAAAFDPVTGGGACAQTDGSDEPGTASYRIEPAPDGGYTLMGSATVSAVFALQGESQVAARLLDVGPEGTQTLVARGLWRPEIGSDEKQVFQLHPNGWVFEQGHVAKLELLPDDAVEGGAALSNYGRASNDQRAVEVSGLQLRLPVAEGAGAGDGFVAAALRKRLPEGAELARGFRAVTRARAELATGALKRRGGNLRAKISCPALFDSCGDGRVVVRKGGKRSFMLARGGFELGGGESKRLSLKLSKRARGFLDRNAGARVRVETSSSERPGAAKQKRRARG